LFAALLVRRRKNITDKKLRHVLLFSPMTLRYPNKNEYVPKCFSTVFQVRLKTYSIYSVFQKTIQTCSKAWFFRSWSSLRQKKHGIHSLPEK
jgi:hypothetical protein